MIVAGTLSFHFTPFQDPHELVRETFCACTKIWLLGIFCWAFLNCYQGLEGCLISDIKIISEVNKLTCSCLVGLKNREGNIAQDDVQEAINFVRSVWSFIIPPDKEECQLFVQLIAV